MKRSVLIVTLVVLLSSMVFCLWMVFAPRDTVDYHKRAWFRTWNRIIRKQQASGPHSLTLLLDELLQRIRGRVDDDIVLRQHEEALLRLGYLAKHDFFVTNQVLTGEFNSNFFQIVQQRFGTNGESIWLCRFSTNRDGWRATLPAKDIAEWERIFRQCAERYASNVPPHSTNAALP